MGICCCVYAVDYVCCNINSGMKTEGNVCSPDVVIYCFGQSDYIQPLFGKEICSFVCAVSAQRKQAVKLLLLIGLLHFGNLINIILLDDLHHLKGSTLCTENCSALG